ncbi:undecaprenyl-phosphate glucose phosphotransferase [Motilimonas eburnea]|uniref:undecaprenyl-phosphate glucose phosphotransferase n=1 Tax=Motilimonas eburnea TaxID=1737488 RepID=UPI001E38855A|nr:undecaprenyl-phosphate glucose phosphotransferase [Motilimonas eburnea]MCE2570635.1 undecaprenyl-phosphate glucose phosphotransferase [Motilimonas eburnea]
MGAQGHIRTFGKSSSFFYRLIDIVVVSLSLFVSLSIFDQVFDIHYFAVALLATVGFTIASESVDLYRSWRGSNFSYLAMLTSLAWIIVCGLLMLLAYFTKLGTEYSRLVIGWWFVIAWGGLLCWRVVLRFYRAQMRRKGLNTRNAVVIGVTPQAISLVKNLQRHPEIGVKVLGFYDDRDTSRLDQDLPARLRGNAERALKLAKKGAVERVYIALPMHAKERISHLLSEFADTTACTYLVPDFFTYNLLHSRWDSVGDIHTLSVFDTPFNGLSSWIKRLEDIVLSSMILALISPVLIAIAVAVKLTSPGPVIFKQFRYGLDGRKIKVWKFRSMSTMDNGDKVVQATKNDPRVTPLGSFLRRTSLDELPQFINVLQGSMSIVGPRPHAVAHNEEYRVLVERYMLRHKVKPGITGWAQINGWRGETDTLEKMEKRVQYDLDYIHRWSLWLDIKIVFLTIFKGFVSKTAY